MQTVTISTKGQIVIPSQVRVDMELNEGDKLLLNTEGNKIVLETQKYKTLGEFFDSLPKAKKFISKPIIREILSRRAVERYEKGLRGHKYNYPVAN